MEPNGMWKSRWWEGSLEEEEEEFIGVDEDDDDDVSRDCVNWVGDDKDTERLEDDKDDKDDDDEDDEDEVDNEDDENPPPLSLLPSFTSFIGPKTLTRPLLYPRTRKSSEIHEQVTSRINGEDTLKASSSSPHTPPPLSCIWEITLWLRLPFLCCCCWWWWW
jgi:hypothetical protein